MPALEVDKVSKIYRVYAKPIDRLKEALLRKPLHQSFESLREISFQVERGDVMGIIGDNGAGKSTLLKILAGTLTPSSGTVKRSGRVAAILELGAGFHPEFSGRQNIQLNAALLGLSHAEIKAREERIIAFSELEEFIERPVKTYSSGMYMRLAFSIATMVEPEILIVDEALSVGDIHFQKKCVDHMVGLKNSGITILFCSHSLYMVEELCRHAMWLYRGGLMQKGEAKPVIQAYNNWVRRREAQQDAAHTAASVEQSEAVWIEAVRVCNAAGEESDTITTGDEVQVQVVIGVREGEKPQGVLGIAVDRSDLLPIFATTMLREGRPPLPLRHGMLISVRFPALPLLAGRYSFNIAVLDEYGLHIYQFKRSREFSVQNRADYLGIVEFSHDWKIAP